MGRHHATDSRSSTRTARSLPRLVLAAGLLIAALATVAGLLVQWPSHEPPPVSTEFTQNSGQTGSLVEGTVAFVQPGMCNSPSLGKVFDGSPVNHSYAPPDCTHAIVDITDGPDAGKRTLLEIRPSVPGSPNLQVGDDILLTTHVAGGGYGFQDFQRSTTMWLWLGAALILITAVGAWRGVRSIVGLAITLGIVALFLIPGLTHGGVARFVSVDVRLGGSLFRSIPSPRFQLEDGQCNGRNASSLGVLRSAIRFGCAFCWNQGIGG